MYNWLSTFSEPNLVVGVSKKVIDKTIADNCSEDRHEFLYSNQKMTIQTLKGLHNCAEWYQIQKSGTSKWCHDRHPTKVAEDP